MNTKTEHIHIMYGLPGSGKTYYCSRNIPRNKSDIVYLNLDYFADKYWYENGKRTGWENWLPKRLKDVIMDFGCRVLYIDGLCTTYKSLHDIIMYIYEYRQGCAEKCMITVHAWNEDRSTCMKNDYKRRAVGSEKTILNAPYETIDSSEAVKEAAGEYAREFLFRLEKHTVIEKPEWKQFAENAGLSAHEETEYGYKTRFRDMYKASSFFGESRIWRSSWWSLGGSGRSYDGSTFSISADTDTSISEVLDLLESIDEKITLKKAREIMDECVKVEEKREGDYYGGCETNAQYVVDLEKLYEIFQRSDQENGL